MGGELFQVGVVVCRLPWELAAAPPSGSASSWVAGSTVLRDRAVYCTQVLRAVSDRWVAAGLEILPAGLHARPHPAAFLQARLLAELPLLIQHTCFWGAEGPWF